MTSKELEQQVGALIEMVKAQNQTISTLQQQVIANNLVRERLGRPRSGVYNRDTFPRYIFQKYGVECRTISKPRENKADGHYYNEILVPLAPDKLAKEEQERVFENYGEMGVSFLARNYQIELYRKKGRPSQDKNITMSPLKNSVYHYIKSQAERGHLVNYWTKSDNDRRPDEMYFINLYRRAGAGETLTSEEEKDVKWFTETIIRFQSVKWVNRREKGGVPFHRSEEEADALVPPERRGPVPPSRQELRNRGLDDFEKIARSIMTPEELSIMREMDSDDGKGKK